MKIPSFLLDRRDRTLAFCFILLAGVAAVFWNVRSADFVSWDDGILVYANPYYVSPAAPSLLFFWQHSFLNLYMPLTYSLWGVLAHLTHTTDAAGNIKLDPTVFHSVSLALHAANCLLAFALLRAILPVACPSDHGGENAESDPVGDIGMDTAALAGALLFTLHPLQVEAVAWVAETKGLLASFFCLASLTLFCRFLAAGTAPVGEGLGNAGSPRRAAAKYWVAATVCFAAALLAKPNVVGTPVIALLLAVLVWRRSLRSALLALWPWFVFAFVMAVAMTFLQADGTQYGGVAPGLRVLVASDALLFYLAKFLYPLNLTINYGRTPVWVAAQGWLYALILVVPFLAFAARRLRSRPLFTVALAWVILALLPNLGFVPFLFQQYSTVTDRYFYFAMMGPSLALAGGLVVAQRGSSGRFIKLATVPLVMAAVALGWLSQRQAAVWRNNQTLYAHTLAVTPRDWVSMTNLANTLSSDGHPNEALALFNKALEINPHAAVAYYSKAKVSFQLRKPEEAIRNYRLAIQYDPKMTAAGMALGLLLNATGHSDEALAEFQKLVELNPAESSLLVIAGRIAFQQENFLEADRYARQAIDANVQDPGGHGLMAIVREQQGDKRSAMQEAGKALELNPQESGARILIARLLWEKNLRTQAENILKEGLQLSPADVDLQAALAGYEKQK